MEEGGTMVVMYALQDNMASVEDCLALLSPLVHLHPNLLQRTFQNYLSDSLFYVGEIDTVTEAENRTALQETCGLSRENGTLVPRTTRAYYGSGGAVHVTGYVFPRQESDNVGNRDLVGRSGIEETLDQELAGRPSRSLQIIADGIVLRELGKSEGTPPKMSRSPLTVACSLLWGHPLGVVQLGKRQLGIVGHFARRGNHHVGGQHG
ncbi:MAG UNVERIFIED_CONTAM: hypothetical protein LVT10_23270 [Anaerolineae bacterium]